MTRSLPTLLDVGCGTGVLGIALKCIYPHMQLYGVDRDALAVRVSRVNASLNGIRDALFEGALGIGRIGGRSGGDRWDLIVCNLPAKAGAPVLKELVQSFCDSVSRGGLIAIVVVRTLKGLVEAALQERPCDIVYRDESRDHVVYHVCVTSPESQGLTRKFSDSESLLNPYIRSTASFHIAGISYGLATAFNLAEFDTIGYATRLALGLLEDVRIEGRVLCWNPGQGHIPVWLNRKSGREISHCVLAGRDLLALEVSRKNLLEDAVKGQVYQIHTPFFYDLGAVGATPAASESRPPSSPVPALVDRMNLQIYLLEQDPNMTWQKAFFDTARLLACDSGSILVVAKSSLMYRILKHRKELTIVKDRKSRGYRGLLLTSY